ncbi:hypothetical protein PBY51_013608 [Eleginops maclovinus]|uniref:Uncharacterized protein n=1 Tax=Eleginops maclovinus TaxID=56733 RepID=A0AAN8AUL2_ELEMC|nr:hypothetical protein PBY51_013608 [Eleginops maclovinus]
MIPERGTKHCSNKMIWRKYYAISHQAVPSIRTDVHLTLPSGCQCRNVVGVGVQGPGSEQRLALVGTPRLRGGSCDGTGQTRGGLGG